jgi:hypothetical protein
MYKQLILDSFYGCIVFIDCAYGFVYGYWVVFMGFVYGLCLWM